MIAALRVEVTEIDLSSRHSSVDAKTLVAGRLVNRQSEGRRIVNWSRRISSTHKPSFPADAPLLTPVFRGRFFRRPGLEPRRKPRGKTGLQSLCENAGLVLNN
jgi:hypothetical protein